VAYLKLSGTILRRLLLITVVVSPAWCGWPILLNFWFWRWRYYNGWNCGPS